MQETPERDSALQHQHFAAVLQMFQRQVVLTAADWSACLTFAALALSGA